MKKIIRNLLPATVPIFEGSAAGAQFEKDLPYVLILTGLGARSDEETIHGRDTTQIELRLRIVGEDKESIQAIQSRLRAGLDRKTYRTDYGVQDFILTDTTPLIVDESAYIPGRGGHPVFADDIYILYTQKEEK